MARAMKCCRDLYQRHPSWLNLWPGHIGYVDCYGLCLECSSGTYTSTVNTSCVRPGVQNCNNCPTGTFAGVDPGQGEMLTWPVFLTTE